VSSNRGEPVVTEEKSLAGQAYRNIARRLLGEEVALINLETENSFLDKLRRMFSGKNNKRQ
jgi:septum site-determining protein MinD